MLKPLPVPHYRQLNDGCCLPAWVQMVLAYWNIERRQQALARQLHMVPDAGTPASCAIPGDIDDVAPTGRQRHILHLVIREPPGG